MSRKKDLPCGVLIHVIDNKYKIRKEYREGYLNVYYYKLPCSVCGKETLQDVSNNKKGNKPICSKECRAISINKRTVKGRKYKASGHVLVYKPEHPNHYKKYVPEHRIVVEEDIGRFLKKEEVVHHVDLVKDNNDIDNLFLCENNTEHFKIHGSLNKCVEELMRLDVLVFDKKEKKYKVKHKGNV